MRSRTMHSVDSILLSHPLDTNAVDLPGVSRSDALNQGRAEPPALP